MQGNDTLKKVAISLAVAHLVEALCARRMAKKRGKSPALYFLLTLFIGFPVMLRLKKVDKVAAEGASA